MASELIRTQIAAEILLRAMQCDKPENYSEGSFLGVA